MNVYKPISPKVFRSPRDLAQILRTKPQNPDFGAILAQEARSSVMMNSNNSIDFYSIPSDKKPVSHKPNHSVEPNFKSVHRSTDAKQSQYLLEKINGPNYKGREKKALEDIRKKKGRLYLLSDVYQEFSKDIVNKFSEEVGPKPKVKPKLERYQNARLVEDLDKWERELIMKGPLSPSNKAVNPGGLINNKHQRLPEIKNSPSKKVVIREPFVSSIEDLAKREVKEKKKVEAEDQGRSPMGSIDRMNDDNLEGLQKEMEDNPKSIEKVEFFQTEESTQEIRDDILGISGKEIDIERIHKLNTKGMTLQQIVEYYKDIGQKQEARIDKKIEKYEATAREQEELILSISRDDDIIARKIRQLTRQLEMVEGKIKDRTTYSPQSGKSLTKQLSAEAIRSFTYDPEDEKNPDIILRQELTQNLGAYNRRAEQNAMDLADAQSLMKSCKEKIRSLQNARRTLYKSILSQGMDTREEGIIWVLKNMLEAGEQVLVADFPVFLDYKSRKFLLEKARAQKEIDELKKIEKATMEVFKTSRDTIFGNEIQFSNLFKPGFRDVILNSGSGVSSPVGSKIYINNTSGDQLSGTQSPIYLDDTQPGTDDTQRKWQEKESREVGSVISKKTWLDKSLEEVENFKRATENEEIYSKTKDFIKNMYKNEESRKTILSPKASVKKTNRMDNEILNDHVKLYQDNILVNNYRNRKEFVMKMQSITVEYRLKQARLTEETEKEAIRIISEYKANLIDKQVELDVYLLSMFGYSEASRYLNRFGLGERKAI